MVHPRTPLDLHTDLLHQSTGQSLESQQTDKEPSNEYDSVTKDMPFMHGSSHQITLQQHLPSEASWQAYGGEVFFRRNPDLGTEGAALQEGTIVPNASVYSSRCVFTYIHSCYMTFLVVE